VKNKGQNHKVKKNEGKTTIALQSWVRTPKNQRNFARQMPMAVPL